jgi:hypothetical protein
MMRKQPRSKARKHGYTPLEVCFWKVSSLPISCLGGGLDLEIPDSALDSPAGAIEFFLGPDSALKLHAKSSDVRPNSVLAGGSKIQSRNTEETGESIGTKARAGAAASGKPSDGDERRNTAETKLAADGSPREP